MTDFDDAVAAALSKPRADSEEQQAKRMRAVRRKLHRTDTELRALLLFGAKDRTSAMRARGLLNRRAKLTDTLELDGEQGWEFELQQERRG